jgi:superfamily I DNA and/or RNA helicase
VIAGTCVGLAGVRAMRDLEFDVCVLDEAGKATATEALVPMVRASRWVLVGDQKQLPPFQEEALTDRAIAERYGLDVAELSSTLFDRVLSGAPPGARVMLTQQYRMAAPIGDLISACFYDHVLKSPADNRLAGPAITHPVVWLDTSELPLGTRREVRAGTTGSIRNPGEARLVAERIAVLRRFLDTGLLDWKPERPLTVLVLSGYRGQVDEMRRRIDTLGPHPRMAVSVKTVDEVQGQEADVCVFSLTRSNSAKGLGFLKFPQRVNVALSRGRYNLIVVGDLRFASEAGGAVGRVADYVAKQPDGCAVVAADDPFASGTA